eukprot:TRINITY_DN22409_c0_g1_i1.p1 TRINITY_DN22409_c0_g1~~TRINITY_DN22409_c0_g1_i1.p1  ORF type:complete len:488 (-),score=68.39 TRINITY_DN22409_c0_g1_i1:74-1537(-)
MKDYAHPLSSCLVAEFVGTFFLVYTSAMNMLTESIGSSIGLGAMLAAMVFSLGSVSGGHFNPAVTLSVWLSGRRKITAWDGLCYGVVQLLAALCAACICQASMLPHQEATVLGRAAVFIPGPGTGYNLSHVLTVEVLYSFALCYVVLNVATTKKRINGNAPNAHFGLAVGFTVTSAAIAIAPISGCSLNPAMSVAGALLSLFGVTSRVALEIWGLYAVAPFVGSFIGAASFWIVRGGMHERDEYIGELDRGEPRDSIRTSDENVIKIPDMFVNNDMLCCLSWDALDRFSGHPISCDLKLACAMFDCQGMQLGAAHVDAKHPHGAVRYTGGEVCTSADSPTSSIGVGHSIRRDEQINFRLCDVPPEVHALVIVVIVYNTGKTFEDVEKYCVSLTEEATFEELSRYESVDLPNSNAQLAAVFFRQGTSWFLKWLDECYYVRPHASCDDLKNEMRTVVAKLPGVDMIMPPKSWQTPTGSTRPTPFRASVV